MYFTQHLIFYFYKIGICPEGRLYSFISEFCNGSSTQPNPPTPFPQKDMPENFQTSQNQNEGYVFAKIGIVNY